MIQARRLLPLLALVAAGWWALDARCQALLTNSFLLVLGTLAVSGPPGVALGWLVARSDLPGRRLLGGTLCVLAILPLWIHVAAFQAGFGPHGWWTALTGRGGLDGWLAAVLVHGLAAVPPVAGIVAAGLRLAEPELEELALLDARPARVFRRVTLRRAAGAGLVAALWVAVSVGGEVAVTDIFRVRTYAEEIFTEWTVAPSETPLAVWPGLLLAVWLTPLAYAWLRAAAPATVRLGLRTPRTWPLGRARGAAWVLVAIAVLLLAGLPLANLLYQAGHGAVRGPDGWTRVWSPEKLVRIVARTPFRYGRELWDSLQLGLLAAGLATVVGGGCAAWMAGSRRRATAGLWLAGLLLAVPGPVLGLGLVRLFSQGGPIWNYLYDETLAAPCLAQFLRALPWATLILWQAFRTVPRGLLDLARLEGAGPWKTLTRIVLPLRRSEVGLAALAALVAAWSELVATRLTSPPGTCTLSMRLFELLHAANEDEIAALCLGQTVAFAALARCGAWLLARRAP